MSSTVNELSSAPAAVGMIARTQHVYGASPGEDGALVRISYSDGMGRVLMHKAQCEPVRPPTWATG